MEHRIYSGTFTLTSPSIKIHESLKWLTSIHLVSNRGKPIRIKIDFWTFFNEWIQFLWNSTKIFKFLQNFKHWSKSRVAAVEFLPRFTTDWTAWDQNYSMGKQLFRSLKSESSSQAADWWLNLLSLSWRESAREVWCEKTCLHGKLELTVEQSKNKMPSVRLELTTFRLWDWRANQLRQEGFWPLAGSGLL